MDAITQAKTGKPRGRPRAFDRTCALEAATRLFWTKGYEATSISDLTEALGIGAPSLYAAFGSKEALYAEALDHYGKTSQPFAWEHFYAEPTARAAVQAFLVALTSALTGRSGDAPTGCMVTLSSVASEGHFELGELVRAGRAITFNRVKERLEQAIAEGEVPSALDIVSLSRFVQAVHSGMVIMARDGASPDELRAVVDVAMVGWDARIDASHALAASSAR